MATKHIIGVVTIYDDRDGYTPHFINHYVELGLDRLFVLVNTAFDDQLLASVQSHARDKPVSVMPVCYTDPFSDQQKQRGEAAALSGHVQPEDWLLHLDLDEFHSYPFRLRTVCDAQDAMERPLISVDMTDRLAEDGRLPKITVTPSIFEQFPWGCRITRHWMSLPYTKVMLCKGWVRLQAGRHSAINAPILPPALGNWDDYKVYHFKFAESFRARSRERRALKTLDFGYTWQLQRMADSIVDDRIIPASAPDVHWCGALQYPKE